MGMWSLSLKISSCAVLTLLLGWHEVIKRLHGEMKWGDCGGHCDIGVGYCWPSDQKPEKGSSASGLRLTTESRTGDEGRLLDRYFNPRSVVYWGALGKEKASAHDSLGGSRQSSSVLWALVSLPIKWQGWTRISYLSHLSFLSSHIFYESMFVGSCCPISMVYLWSWKTSNVENSLGIYSTVLKL